MAGVTRSLKVELGGMPLATPVMVAAGCAGTGREWAGLVDVHKVGAIVSRTVTLIARKGTPTPRVSESPSGVVWESGLQNPGIEAFVDEELPRLARPGTPVVVSIGGTTMEEYVRLTSILQGRQGVSAIEIHLSGRDDELGRELLGDRADRAAEITGAVARMSHVPVFAKLPPVGAGLVEVATAVARAGVTGLTLCASPRALAVDAPSLVPDLGSVTGWLSGPAVLPLTLRAVFDVARALPDVPIIAVGGVRDGDDAVQLLLAGAWAVQVGTAALIDPIAPVEVAQGVARYLKNKGLASPNDIRGRLRVPAGFDPPEEEARP
ncbi:MAG: dihydroorotate dehydrogenase catalytic subunit [Actinomycetota bacterium]|jgi:dihydroorotate dehydrogenase (NAD+) catalytic subunit|nr:dihydroorotate dehydrogenase catalytic subunit [Actinomycetota bacterium]